MLNQISRLDQLSTESDHSTRNPYASDEMRWYVRLANLKKGIMEAIRGLICNRLVHDARSGMGRLHGRKLRLEVDRMDAKALEQRTRKSLQVAARNIQAHDVRNTKN